MSSPAVGMICRNKQLEITGEDRGCIHLIRVVGDLDVHTGVTAQEQMQERIQELHARNEGRPNGEVEVIIDLSESLADGSGILNLKRVINFARAFQFSIRFLDCRAARHVTHFGQLPMTMLLPAHELPS